MAIGAGDRVRFNNVTFELATEPPLFGFCLSVGPVVIAWQNGLNQSFASLAPLSELANVISPASGAVFGKTVTIKKAALDLNSLGPTANRLRGVVIRVFVDDPDGTPNDRAVVRTKDGLYYTAPVADLEICPAS